MWAEFRHYLLLLWAVTALSCAGAQADPLPRSVLIVDQSGAGTTAYAQMVDAFRSNLQIHADPALTVYHEKLDLNVFGGPSYRQSLEAFIHEKYRGRAIGIIVALGEKALECAISMREKEQLDIPIVFAVVSDQAPRLSTLPPNVTGRTVHVSFANYVKAARALVPELKEIALLGDPLKRQAVRSHFETELAALDLKIIDLTGLPIRTLKERIAHLPADAAVVYTTINLDGDNNTITPREALRLLSQHANRPIVVDVATYLEDGATGGFVIWPATIGRETAELTTQVFNAAGAAQIPLAASAAMKPAFSWPQLRKWQIDESSLPAGSEVLFREIGFWQTYRWQILLFGLALALQSVLIISLLYEDRRRRTAEIESSQLRAELAHLDRMATAGELSASIAHEIRQPLAAIVAFGTAGLRWLEREKPDLAEARKSLSTIVDEGHRADQVISNVRAMFKPDDRPPMTINANKLVRKVLSLSSTDIRKNDTVLKLDLDESAPLLVSGNEVQLQQVLLNLIANAVDAMKPVGDRPRVLGIVSEPVGADTVVIAVQDTGGGIDPKNMARVFEPFVTTKATGMGLGLAICKSIIESHSGRLTVATAAPHGTIFRIVLPRVMEAQL